ncbi:hypothetical protein PSE_3065 [Pseudovibrio sp. FO-BEG1]|nr:hypothetical protein PSE_3065 [Pseudovibrio sp. FO-BEG1]
MGTFQNLASRLLPCVDRAHSPPQGLIVRRDLSQL